MGSPTAVQAVGLRLFTVREQKRAVKKDGLFWLERGGIV